jgi:phage shock protein PspC (stress-responsive transcriptional regulator)
MKKLIRYPDEGFLGGVCYGLGKHTGVDPLLWRTLAVFSGGGPIIYLVLWALLKKKDHIS